VKALSESLNAAAFFVDRHVAEGRGARTAFRVGGRVVTYAEVADRVAHAAGALREAGLDGEQRVLLALNDSPAFAAVFWGAAKLGAVAVPVNTLMTAAEYEFLLNDSRARVAVVEAEVAPRVLEVRERCPWLRAILVRGGNVRSTEGNKGRIFHSYVNRRVDVLVDQRGTVISFGLY